MPFALSERGERLLQRLAAQGELDLLVREELLAGEEVADDRVPLIADRLIEARRRPRRRAHLARLLDRQARLLGDFLQRRLPPETGRQAALGVVHLLQPLD